MKNYTWEELRQHLKECEYSYELLSDFPTEWRWGFALAFAILTWAPDNPNRGHGSCGICQYRDLVPGRSCYKPTGAGMQHWPCPLAVKSGKPPCSDPGALWFEWRRTGNPVEREKAADKIYNILVELYAEEYNR